MDVDKAKFYSGLVELLYNGSFLSLLPVLRPVEAPVTVLIECIILL